MEKNSLKFIMFMITVNILDIHKYIDFVYIPIAYCRCFSEQALLCIL